MSINNPQLYNAAVAGLTGGMQERWLKSASSYVSFQAFVNTIATEIDAQIATTTPGQPQIDLLQSIIQGVFANRYPTSSTAGAYTDIATSIAALYNQLSSLLQPGGGAVVSGLIPDNSTTVVANSNTTIIQAYLTAAGAAGGGIVTLPTGKFSISSTLNVPSDVSMIGAGIGKTTLYMPAAFFTNTILQTYNTDSMAIDASGLLIAPFTAATNIVLADFTIESQVSDGRFLIGIRSSNVRGLTIHDIEVFGFPVGNCIALNSILRDGRVFNCYLHDCTTALNTYASQPQMTGIEIDNNKVNAETSRGLAIYENYIFSLQFIGAALAAYNMQTDGINPGDGTALLIHDNYIHFVGEGIDCFATDCDIHNNTLIECYIVGIKLIHGALRNQVHDNYILRPGLGGILLSQSNQVAVDTADNVVCNNVIDDVDGKSGAWATPAGIILDSGGAGPTGFILRNTIARNRIMGGTATMKYGIYQQAGTGNRFIDNEVEGFVTAYSTVSAGTATITDAKKAFVRVGMNSDQATTAGVGEVIEYATETLDTQGEFNTGTHVYTAKAPRRLRVYATATVNDAAGERYSMRIRKNGNATAQKLQCMGATPPTLFDVSDIVSVEIGDTIDIFFEQSNGNRTIVGDVTWTYLTIDEVANEG